MPQTAALLHKLQLDATFHFSPEQQKKHLAQVFGCVAPEPPAPTQPAAPHGSSRVAAFLACSAAAAPVPPPQQQQQQLQQQQLEQQQQQQQQQQLEQQPPVRAVVAAGAAVANPDEISLE